VTIKEIRRSKKRSQIDAAAALGITERTLRTWEINGVPALKEASVLKILKSMRKKK